MSEKTANAGHKNQEYAEVCIGQIISTEKGLEMPPQYAYRIDFKGEDVMVIPLEGNSKKKTVRDAVKVEKPRQAISQKNVSTKPRKGTAKVEEGREEA